MDTYYFHLHIIIFEYLYFYIHDLYIYLILYIKYIHIKYENNLDDNYRYNPLTILPVILYCGKLILNTIVHYSVFKCLLELTISVYNYSKYYLLNSIVYIIYIYI